MVEAQDLFDRGLFSQEQLDRIQGFAQQQFDQTQEAKTTKQASARQANLDFGVTAEQRQAILIQAGGSGTDPQKELADNTKAAAHAAVASLDLQRGMADSLRQLVAYEKSSPAPADLGA